MITDVIIVYNDDSQIKELGDTEKLSPNFVLLNENLRENKRKAFMLKSHWAARLSPFAICMENDKPIKAFYSEAENVISSLIKFLNE